jgi:hypothetical protein
VVSVITVSDTVGELIFTFLQYNWFHLLPV